MPVNLPLILVSASDFTNASNLISEIIDNEAIDGDEHRPDGRVWRLVNKYYRADVRLCPLADGEPLRLPPDDIEAHIIYITEAEEGARPELAAERRRAAAGAAARAAVRLVLSAGARAPAALEAWARRRGYEPVALRERGEGPADAGAGPEDAGAGPEDAGAGPEDAGAGRARAALHAHTWRGLQRVDAPRGAAAAVERAEAFAEALGALGPARAAATALPDHERRRRAERVLAAFCRALADEPPPP